MHGKKCPYLTTLISIIILCLVHSSAGLYGKGEVAEKAGKYELTKSVVDPTLFQALEYRLIGPFRGGRAPAVSGILGDIFTYYMGTSGGGVWKTEDAGETWINISDGFFQCSSIGALAVSEFDSNIIYVGTGEANLRGDVQTGLGVYKSMDGGKTWIHAGLEKAGQIGRIRIHPKNPDLVYVAVLGHAFGPNPDRGVYRSKDGGTTWEKVLFVSDKAGAVDLAMNPHNPRVLFAAIYQVIRKPWILISGGEDSGLYKSADGGDTWTKLTKGIPEGIKGRIGITVSPADPSRVWAIIEADEGGIFFSDNEGQSFARINKDRKVRTRPFYFSHIYADPVDEDTVYVMGIDFYKSTNRGKDFTLVNVPHGDVHDMWVNPENPKIMVNGNDGGGCVSFNGGLTWSTQMNQPTAEFYRVTTDNQFFYRVYGAQQDNSTVSIASRTPDHGISIQNWYGVGGGEQGHIWVDPRDPNIVYAGIYYNMITRYDHETGQTKHIEIYPELNEGQAAEDMRFRVQMNAPIRISPHDPKILYHTSQHVHRSTDEGTSWEIISPDLTRNDKSKQKPSGGPITLDHTGPEIYDTIFAFEESPQTPGLLWVGTDDGLVHISRDNGKNWTDITPRDMPEWGTVNMIDPSSHDPGRAFIAVHRYRLDDFQPYVFRTDDFGQTWTLLTKDNGIPPNHFIRVVREDPDWKGLLYAGTEFGMYISFDDGKNWQPFQLNLPTVQVADIVVKNKDLVVATHGRSFWILDDLTPLHQINAKVSQAEHFLFKPRTAFRLPGSRVNYPRLGKNPPNGALIHYYLAEEPDQTIKLDILNEKGNSIQSYSVNEAGEEKGRLSAKKGMNRFVWNLRLPSAELIPGTILFGRNIGPYVVPGTYSVKLTIGDWSQTKSFVVKADPRLQTSKEDFDAQLELALRARDKVTETHCAISQIRDIRSQIENLNTKIQKMEEYKDVAELGESVVDRLMSIERKLTQVQNETPLDTCNFPPQIDDQLLFLQMVIISADSRPTESSFTRFNDLQAELTLHLERLKKICEQDIPHLNSLISEKDIPPITMPKL